MTGAEGAAPILLVEDTVSLQMVYRTILEDAGYPVVLAPTLAEARRAFADHRPRVVVLDLMLPDGDGQDLIDEMLQAAPETAVIVVTAHGSINRAVAAIRAGAQEFIVKPFDERRFLAAVANALRPPSSATPRAPSEGRRPSPGRAASEGFIGSSQVMARVHATIRSAARSMATVFITGESGTGKELCALAVHESSPRAAGPFIALNCGAIPQELLESEVFGHVKGSFTGAIADKPGAAVLADGGTLFLDEVCEMAPALQTKLLRFLQTSMVQPVGAPRPRKVDVRIVCATNRDPLDAVRRGHFREDLYYRLFVLPIHMPPLRERGEDAVEIAHAALARFSAEEGRVFEGFAPSVEHLLRTHPWPGNVRQVLNVIRNVVVLNEGGLITLDKLPPELVRNGDTLDGNREPLGPTPPDIESLAGLTMAEIERQVIEAAIARHQGSVPRAARALDLSPSTLYRKLESWATTAR